LPELPEVEVTARAVSRSFLNKKLNYVEIFNRNLRWPVPSDVQKLNGLSLTNVSRRAKFIKFEFEHKQLLCHLGMSGSFRNVRRGFKKLKHDHVLFKFSRDFLCYNDPRRFGLILWTDSYRAQSLLSRLGVEPFSEHFSGMYLKQAAKKRRLSVKAFLMHQSVVVGVGNIYASEALFAAGITPQRRCDRISLDRYNILTEKVKLILLKAINAGGTTIADFHSGNGSAGNFQQDLLVYGLDGEPCRACGNILKKVILSGRSSYFCRNCQS